MLKDMEVEHWCFGCVLKGKQGRLKAFQLLMYKLLHVTGSWRTCHLSTVNLIYRTYFNITAAQAEVVDDEQEDFENQRQEPAETDHNTIFQQSCNNHQAVGSWRQSSPVGMPQNLPL
jgi:hypothetical protein